ncbi:MAG TPA: YidC/Oxa1 family membrane protein insertase, partial [Myxococcota bacterium]|nr:YidC/Oxa1 family membrane protein insertase [Myxococcota bacterium]
LPILMGATMLIQQAFTPPPPDQPQMKYVMWAMPVFLTFIMLNMPSGLSLYILTNNLLTILQQLIIKKRSENIAI